VHGSLRLRLPYAMATPGPPHRQLSGEDANHRGFPLLMAPAGAG